MEERTRRVCTSLVTGFDDSHLFVRGGLHLPLISMLLACLRTS
jgi:hypothetical protein